MTAGDNKVRKIHRQTVSKQEIIYAFNRCSQCSPKLLLNDGDMQRNVQMPFYYIYDIDGVHVYIHECVWCMMYEKGATNAIKCKSLCCLQCIDLTWYDIMHALYSHSTVYLIVVHTHTHTHTIQQILSSLHMFIELVHFCDYKSIFDILSPQYEQFELYLLEYSFISGGNWESIAQYSIKLNRCSLQSNMK